MNTLVPMDNTMVTHETSAVAVAEQAKAAVQARYMMAMHNRRNMEDVRTQLLKECSRSTFAKVAQYQKPVSGSRITGFSIRFAEQAMRIMQNLLPETYVVYDDDDKRILRVMLTDLESNLTYSKDVIITKTVERRNAKGDVISERRNSSGNTVYLVKASEDEFLNKQNAQESKVLRNHMIRLLPGDPLDECEKAIAKTRSQSVDLDPDHERKQLLTPSQGGGSRLLTLRNTLATR